MKERNVDHPLSFAQERLWLAQAIEPESYRYNEVIVHRVVGPLRLASLAEALVQLAERHEVLRTTYSLRDEGPCQNVQPASTLGLVVVDLSAFEASMEILRRELDRVRENPFHLDQEPPVRAVLFRCSPQESFLAIGVHHIACDRISATIFIDELCLIYEALSNGKEPALPPVAAQYSAFAAWERRSFTDERLDREAEYWRSALENASPPLLPFRKRSDQNTLAAGAHTLTLDPQFVKSLSQTARKSGTTIANVLLTGLACLLSRYTSQSNITIALPLAARHKPQLQKLIGLFVNTVVMPVEVPDKSSFAELLSRVSRRAFEVYARGDVPFSRVAERHGVAIEPLLEVAWTFLGAELPASRLSGGVRFEPADGVLKDKAVFPLEFLVVESQGSIQIRLVYAKDLFDDEPLARFLTNYENLLRAGTSNPEHPISRLLLDQAEVDSLFALGTGPEEPLPDKDFIQLFRRSVGNAPHAAAVTFGDQTITYSELDTWSNRIAGIIREASLETEDAVAVMLERSPEVVVSLLACLKAGVSYLPVSRAYPRERVQEILSDANVKLVLTVRAFAGDAASVPVVCLDEIGAGDDGFEIETQVPQNRLAYVIYTSGSTGRPKGVMVQRGGMLNHLLAKVKALDLGPTDVVTFNAPISFDISIWQMLTPLLAGACIRIVAEEDSSDPVLLIKDIVAGRVTIFETVPSMLGAMLDTPECEQLAMSELWYLISNAEALPPGMCDRFRQKLRTIRLLNAYGPTECSDDVTHFEITTVEGFDNIPVGSPIANTQLYVLDQEGELSPRGVTGELYIGGTGVARGYLNRPTLTAEKFVPDPFATVPGMRMYRTGDVVRWREDGELEFLGRADQQVKLRGYRIELGEVEAVLSQHAGVQQCVVVVRGSSLIGYVVGTAEVTELHEHLAKQLPSYMVPRLIKLISLPLTSNGKIDRKALPEPEQSEEVEKTKPRTPAEELLCGIWAEVLGREHVGREENFFELGGHSLLATKVVSRMRAVFGVEVALRVLFERPTVAAMAAEVELAQLGGAAMPALERVDRTGPLPLSFAQQRLWFIEQLEPGKTAYNVPLAVSLSGELDYEALRAALSEIVRRHEVLRTRFVNEDGEAVQVIEAARAVLVPVIDLTQLGEPAGEVAAKRIAHAEAKRAFEVSKGELLRTALVRLDAREHVLVVVLHHIVSDGWSVGVLINEFNVLYEAYRQGETSPLPELPLQYGDYAVWQRNSLQGEVLERELQYWRRQLNGLERFELPADKSRSEKTGHGEVVRFEIETDLLERLRQLSRREGVTLFMLLAAGLKLVLNRYAGQSDVAIGTAIANRNRVEIEPLVGFFVNQLVLRTQVDRDLSVRDLLKRVRETVLGAYAHQDLPFERLVEDIAPSRDAFRSPLFQVMLVMQNFVNAEMQLQGLATANLNIGNGDAKYDLMLTLDERAGEIVAELEFSTDLFTRATIERFGEHYLRVLDACTRDVEQKLSSIKLTSEAETARLIAKVNAAAHPFPAECVHESFRRQAAKTPNAIAVEDDQVAWTYAELDRYSDYVARNLVRARVSPGSLVAICLERGVEMVAAILGVLKAGAAYVPLDANYPVDRLEYMLRDSGVAATITDDRLDVSGAKLLISDLLSETSGQQLPHVSPDTLAYVIYTSGSTGAPKGVAITHAGLSNHMSWFDEAFALDADDRVLQKTVVSFDASVWEFYAPLLTGGTLVMASPGAHADPATLIENIRRKRVTMVQVVPTMLRLLVNHAGWDECTSLRFVFCGGEALTDELSQRVFETSCAELVNLYGPTECTIQVAYWRSSGGKPVAIGGPVANVSLYVLDREGELSPQGVSGELYIGGAGVGRGYLNQPAMTASRFVPDPFSTVPGKRMYRTGDLVRWREDGELDFLGRADQQVKLRGYRIELGEIEAVLSQHVGVQQCVVVVRDSALIGYVVGTAEVSELREHLAKQLPSYMVPRLMKLASLPLTSNGKLDRKALPEPEQSEEHVGPVGPRTPAEELLCGIWAEVLGRETIGIHDNFFELGGDSILSIQVVARATQAGLRLMARDMFEHQTIARLSEVSGKQEIASTKLSDVGELPLTPIQEWFYAQQWQRPWHYNQGALLADATYVDGRRLQETVEQVLNSHAVFRLRFGQNAEGKRYQQYEREARVRCGSVDLCGLPGSVQSAVVEAVAEQAQQSLAPEDGRLVAAMRLEGSAEGWLLVVAHHLVIDGVSWRILLDEVERRYAGQQVTPVVSSSYGEWAQRLVAEAAAPETAAELDYWVAQQEDEELPREQELGVNKVETSESVTVQFSETETEALLREVPRHLRAPLEAVLLLGVVEAVCDWSGRESLVVLCEGHGREPLSGVAVEQTVGWFTTIYPVRFEYGAGSVRERLRSVQQRLQAVPRRGLGYGLLKYVQGAAALAGKREAAVSFNYLGQWDANLTGIFKGAAESVGSSQWSGEERSQEWDVVGSVHGGRLRLAWTYSGNHHWRETMERIAAKFRAVLEEVIAACRDENVMPSDIDLSDMEWDDLLAEVGARE